MDVSTDIIRLVIGRFQDTGVETLSNICVFDNDELVFSCVGLELPWKNNEHQISCIPIGSYSCEKVPATPHIPYDHISVMNVPNRDGICIHYGNYAAGIKIDVKGCIIVGNKFADINSDNNLDIINSRITLDKLLLLLPSTFNVYISSTVNKPK